MRTKKLILLSLNQNICDSNEIVLLSTQNIVKLMGKKFFTLKFCLSTLVLKCQPMTAVWIMCTYYDKYDNRDSLLSRTGMFDYELIIY